MDSAGGYANYAFTADFYDYVPPYRTRQDVAFYVEASKEAEGLVLEIGCGTGRVLIPTARAGVDIVGLDLSSPMLKVCRERLERESAEVQSRAQLVKEDMRTFSLDQTFRLVTTPFRPFQHLITVEDQMACLTNIHQHLEVGGRLILDIFNPSLEMLTREDIGEEFGDEPEFTTPDGRRVIRRQKIVAHDRFRQVNRVEIIFYVTYPDGRKERLVHDFDMRYLFRYEVEHLLARCGFEMEDLYAGYDKSSFGSQYPGELICVARKGD